MILGTNYLDYTYTTSFVKSSAIVLFIFETFIYWINKVLPTHRFILTISALFFSYFKCHNNKNEFLETEGQVNLPVDELH